MIRVGKKPLPAQFNSRARTSISLEAQKAKGLDKGTNNVFPASNVVKVSKSQEGSVRLSTLLAIPSGAAGFLTGSYVWFKYMAAESVAKQLGVEVKDLEFFNYLLDPAQNTDRDSILTYSSIVAMGGVVAFVAACLPLIPRGFNGSDPQQPE